MFRLSIERIMAKNAPERRLLQLRGVLSPKIEIRMCSNKDNGKNGEPVLLIHDVLNISFVVTFQVSCLLLKH